MEPMLEALRRHPLFAGLDEAWLRDFCAKTEERQFAPNEVILDATDRDGFVVFVFEGEVAVMHGSSSSIAFKAASALGPRAPEAVRSSYTYTGHARAARWPNETTWCWNECRVGVPGLARVDRA
jgi:hypothetical protein